MQDQVQRNNQNFDSQSFDFANNKTQVSLYHGKEKYVDSDSLIMPYKGINRIFTTLYGIISTGSLSADLS